jgi:hypothetical protein
MDTAMRNSITVANSVCTSGAISWLVSGIMSEVAMLRQFDLCRAKLFTN